VNKQLTNKGWLGKVSAAAILGFTLSIALTGLFAWFGPGAIMQGSAKIQLTMWLISPLWGLMIAFCFLFRSGRAAWGWLALANIIAFSLLWGGRELLS